MALHLHYNLSIKNYRKTKNNAMENTKDHTVSISRATLQRLPKYYCYLQEIQKLGTTAISSTTIADDLNLNAIQVRKDLAEISSVSGKPRVGFEVDGLMRDIETYLGYNNVDDTILVGCGRLGSTLLAYDGFKSYGFNIVAGFDINTTLTGSVLSGKPVFPLDQLSHILQRLKIQIGIITVPKQYAQQVADLLIRAGIKAIWNFAPVHLKVPDGILVRDENLAASLALLSNKLKNENQ